MRSVEAEKAGYWDSYYVAKEEPRKAVPPSQFAAFVAQEFAEASHVVDVGCGSGRDSIFFAQQDFHVLGLDGSLPAIEACRAVAEHRSLSSARFQHSEVSSLAFPDDLAAGLGGGSSASVVYARFVLHALTESEQELLLKAVASVLRPGDHFAVEYRTTRDAALAKETSAHYRRFIDPAELLILVTSLGFAVDYAAEGFGYAKYRHDDAHVARAVFLKQ